MRTEFNPRNPTFNRPAVKVEPEPAPAVVPEPDLEPETVATDFDLTGMEPEAPESEASEALIDGDTLPMVTAGSEVDAADDPAPLRAGDLVVYTAADDPDAVPAMAHGAEVLVKRITPEPEPEPEPLGEPVAIEEAPAPEVCPVCNTSATIYGEWRAVHARYSDVLDPAKSDRRPSRALRDEVEAVTAGRERRWVCPQGHSKDE